MDGESPRSNSNELSDIFKCKYLVSTHLLCYECKGGLVKIGGFHFFKDLSLGPLCLHWQQRTVDGIGNRDEEAEGRMYMGHVPNHQVNRAKK